ncbi:hypothetical protein LTR53_002651 [Teratosphaeriaceae sp. CCFEE 6253]|nr:hypothetical protein LTR53_002651 [Teratosphaeriaceae sp. CCFEE 6253]
MAGAMDDWEDWKNVLSDVDVPTAELIVRLQLEDIGALAPAVNDQDHNQDQEDQASSSLAQTERTNTTLAHKLFTGELEKCQRDLSVRKISEPLENIENARQQALEDAAFGWHFDDYENAVEQAQGKPVTCTSCGDNRRENKTVKAPCDHIYCDDCLRTLYRASMVDETLFPPRCCRQEFDWDIIHNHLTDELGNAFQTKRIELQTKNRTYCHVSRCSAFINPADYVDNNAPCPNGCVDTCVACKQATHAGACPTNEELAAFLAAAGLHGWQRCFDCNRVVELRTGCNHMTCVCRAEFCYVCGLRWKTCACPQWHEERLTERAEAVVDNGNDPDGLYQDREAQVRQAAQHLRENHECEHDRWTRQYTGSLQCEECHRYQQQFVDECRQCNLRACYRCRTNRL